jgi:hypothetical protein
MHVRILLTLSIVLAVVPNALAQAQSEAARDALLKSRWDAIFAEVLQERGLQVTGNRLSGTDEAKRAAYREVIRRLVTDPQMQSDYFVLSPDEMRALVDARTPEAEALQIARLAESGIGERGAKSTNAASTNPAGPKGTERSGFSDLVAFSLDTKNIVSADASAFSINLNAVALVGLDSKTRSAPAAYRRHDALRRVAGTFTFGAKVPEGEITGITALPSAETLFDVFSWDAKVRVIGDRDPRARRWDTVMLATMGGLTQMSGTLPGLVPLDDLKEFVVPILNERLGFAVAAVRDRLGRSLQVSVKAAGQHLTTEKGKNKYSVALLGDQGFGDTDLTFNLLYSATEDVTLSPGSLFTIKTFTAGVGINTLVAHDLLVQGRATELSLNANFDAPVDAAALPIARKTLWRLGAAITLPWAGAASIPVSFTYTNDPNSLKDQRYVSGHIGISYDFGALKSLFKPQISPIQ